MPDSCPSETTIRDYLAGELAEVEALQVERHLDGCAACLEISERFWGDDDLLQVIQRRSLADGGQEVESLIDRIKRKVSSDSVSQDGPAPKRLGEFEIVREIGRGGMGVVYEARQTTLDRRVALKVLLHGGQLDTRRVHRFEYESRILASLHHTNIAPVYAVGKQDGLSFYAMQFIDGRGLDAVISQLRESSPANPSDALAETDVDDTASSIARALRSRHIPTTVVGKGGTDTSVESSRKQAPDPDWTVEHLGEIDELAQEELVRGNSNASGSGDGSYWRNIAQVGEQAAEALHYAHEQGILHRDIKPSNLMLDLTGTLWVTDFGLAKALDQDDLTRSGEFLGTLRYMPPEQLRREADGRSDIYSLALTLYELATLRPARTESDPRRLLKLLDSDTIQAPRQFSHSIPRDLETIILKAASVEPEQRYQTACELAEDLRRFLEDRPILARRESLWERFGRWHRRNPALARAIMASVATFFIAFTLVTALWRIADFERKRAGGAEALERGQRVFAERSEAKALAARERTRESLYAAHLNLAQTAFENSDPRQGIEYLSRHIPSALESDLRSFEWYYWWERGRRFLSSFQERQSVFSVQISPDNTTVATAGMDGPIHFWDRVTGKLLQRFSGHADWVGGIAFAPNGNYIASASQDRTVRLWDLETGEEVWRKTGDRSYRDVAFSPDGKILAAGDNGAVIRLWKVDTGETAGEFLGHRGDVYHIEFSNDGQWLASASGDESVKVWNVASGEIVADLDLHEDRVRRVRFAPDDRILASASYDATAILWDTATWEPLHRLVAHDEEVYGLAFAPDGRTLATSSRDDSIRLWDVASGREHYQIRGHIFTVYSVVFSPDGGTLFSCGHDKTIKHWDVSYEDPPHLLSGHSDGVTGIAIAPRNDLIASSGGDQTVRLWDSTTGENLKTLDTASGAWCVDFAPNGRLVAAGCEDGSLWLWPLHTDVQPRRIGAHESDILGVDFAPDSNTVATSGEDGTIRLWDANHGERTRTLAGHTARVYSVQFSPSGRRLVSGSEDETVRVWDPRNGRVLQVLDGHHGRIYAVAVSPDGTLIASGAQDREIRLWQLETGKLLRILRSHSVSVQGLAFLPDGRTLASGSTDRSIKLWDVETGELKTTLNGHAYPVHCVTFSPSGQLLASGSADSDIRLWHAPRTGGIP